jgi:hypothetical protein
MPKPPKIITLYLNDFLTNQQYPSAKSAWIVMQNRVSVDRKIYAGVSSTA